MAIENSGGMSLLQAVKHSFPKAQLDSCTTLLLRSSESCRFRFTRTFMWSTDAWKPFFEKAREALREVVCLGNERNKTMFHGRRARRPAYFINFRGDYSSTNFDELEIDGLVKLAVPEHIVWTRDPALKSDIFHITQTGLQPLTRAPVPDAAAIAAAAVANPDAAADAAAAAAAADLHGRPDLSEDASDDNRSTNTAEHYPPEATHYVVGEAYGRLNLDKPNASKPVQKLLQLERNLSFLQAKEGKDDICSCVLGAVLIGPSMNSATCAAVFAALSNYKSALRRLWALSEAKRFFAIRLQPLVTQVHQSLNVMRANFALAEAERAADRAKVDATSKELAAQREEGETTRAEIAAMRTCVAEISAKLDTILARQAADDVAAVGGGGGLHRGGGGGNQHGGGRRRRHRHGLGHGGGQRDAGGQ